MMAACFSSRISCGRNIIKNLRLTQLCSRSFHSLLKHTKSGYIINRNNLYAQSSNYRNPAVTCAFNQSVIKFSVRDYCELTPDPATSVHGELVYEGTIARMVRVVKGFSLSTSIIGFGFQPYIFYNAAELGKLAVVLGGMCSFFILGTPLLLHWITRKYVTQLYYDRQSKQFTAFTISFFLVTKTVTYKASDVEVPSVPGLFTTLVARGTPLFVDMNYFQDIEVYRHMMGYDKPIDWTFPEDIQTYQKEKQEKD